MRSPLFLISVALLAGHPTDGQTQEMEPYAYAPNPVGVNFLLFGYGEIWGEILFDSAVPVTDVNASWHNLVLGYGRTFGMFGRAANLAIVAPYVTGDVSGNVEEVFTEITRTGLADPRFRLSVNLIGAPALSREEFAAGERGTTLGFTMIVAPPMGRYHPDKLINIGSNRWSVKSELGLSFPAGKWRWEIAAGVWVFGDNDDFFGGQLREQNPIPTFQGHVIYTFRPRAWIAINANWFRGGQTSIDGIRRADLQSSSRLGLTASYPLNRNHSLKFDYSTGATTRIGGDFQRLTLIWQYAWF